MLLRHYYKGAVVLTLVVMNHVLAESGTIPSIVPERATQWFFIHARDRETVKKLRGRIETLARNTAEASGTDVAKLGHAAWGLSRRAIALVAMGVIGEKK